MWSRIFICFDRLSWLFLIADKVVLLLLLLRSCSFNDVGEVRILLSWATGDDWNLTSCTVQWRNEED